MAKIRGVKAAFPMHMEKGFFSCEESNSARRVGKSLITKAETSRYILGTALPLLISRRHQRLGSFRW
jgi:hypothetical protein